MGNRVLGAIELTGKQISGEFFCGTGLQLIKLLQVIGKRLESCTWYAVDILTNNELPSRFPGRGEFPSSVGNTDQLIELASKVDQFLSGVFLSVPKPVEKPIWSFPFDTEDLPTDDIGDAVLVIHAFDTTFWGIYTSHPELIGLLRKHFPDRSDYLSATL